MLCYVYVSKLKETASDITTIYDTGEQIPGDYFFFLQWRLIFWGSSVCNLIHVTFGRIEFYGGSEFYVKLVQYLSQ